MVRAIFLASLLTMTLSGSTFAADSSAPPAAPQDPSLQAQPKQSDAPVPGNAAEAKKDQPSSEKQEPKQKPAEG